MNYASMDLVKEHEGILFGLTIIEKMVSLLKKDGKIETGDFQEMVNFLKLFADKCHHGKEEDLFFPELEKAGIPNQNGPIGQMLLEHAEGRKYIGQMGEALSSTEMKSEELAEAATNYIVLLRQHINKENTVLFPMADRMLTLEKQEELLDQFEKFETNVMGEGTHEKLHELLHEMSEKYLKGND